MAYFTIYNLWTCWNIVNPYVKATYSELYAELRKEYKENKKVNYELLNDDLLFESNEHSKYPCEETKKLKLIITKITN